MFAHIAELADLLHRASFRDGLSNSIYAPAYSLHNLSPDVLEAYRQRHFTTDRLTLVGVGISHDDMIRHAALFRLPKATATYSRSKARFLACKR
jgi:hypothetical protein